MYNLTKAQVKIRLIIALIIAIIMTIVSVMTGMAEGQYVAIVILAPVIFTWAFSTITFGPMEFLKNMVLPECKSILCFFTLRFGEGIKLLIHPFVWYVKALIEVIKLTFWSFSKDK